MKAKTKTPAQLRKDAESKLAAVTAQAEAKVMERTLALLESPQPVTVPWKEYPQFDHWGMGGSSLNNYYLWTSPDDRTEGRYRPLYENAFDVRRMRAQHRSLVELFPVARGALQKLSDYVIGTGWEFVAQPKHKYKKDPLAMQIAMVVQGVLDDFLECNNFIGNMDREIHEESRIDGDSFPTLYCEGEKVRIELTDPGFIAEPLNTKPLENYLGTAHRLNGWWHGVHTLYDRNLKRDDVAYPLGYHAVFDNLGDQWDYLPTERVEHIKRNVGRMARVGVGDFLTIREDLENEAKVRKNTAVGAAINAAIVGIRQHAEGTTKASIEGMVQANSTYNYQRQTQDSSSTVYGQHVPAGTVKDIPAGMEWLAGPLGSLRSPIYIEVAQYLLRIIGSPWSMPEYLISGDASNANYASTLVSESPFVKYCEHEQAFYGGHFERLMWKALRMYHMMKKIPYDWRLVVDRLEINAEYASPATTDQAQQIDTDERLHALKVKSKRSIAADHDLDYDEEQQLIDREPAEAPKVVQVGPGGFGGFGGGYGESARRESTESRESYLAIRAMDALLEGSRNANP